MKRFLKLWFEKVLPKLIKAWLFSKRIITEAKVLSRDYAKGFWKKLSPHRALIVIALIAGIIGGIISWAILPKPEIQFEIMKIETIETGEKATIISSDNFKLKVKKT